MQKLSYTPAQAAEITGLSRGTIFNLLKSGELTRIKVGKRTLIRAQELADYLNNAAQAA